LVIGRMGEDSEIPAAMEAIVESNRMTLKFRKPLQPETASGSHGG
jgi:hypothetical protein